MQSLSGKANSSKAPDDCKSIVYEMEHIKDRLRDGYWALGYFNSGFRDIVIMPTRKRQVPIDATGRSSAHWSSGLQVKYGTLKWAARQGCTVVFPTGQPDRFQAGSDVERE